MHERFMEMALELAAKAMGRTSPNPMVGAVIVKDGKVVGRGYHTRAGEPHAEVVALEEAGDDARGGTIYVNLEPCCHHGRTGPCTEALLEAGISRAVIAVEDPNPLVAGKGIKRLKEGGIEVITGVLAERALRLNEVFIKYVTSGLPFVVLKTAMSLDGKIATQTGDSRWITGREARARAHELRNIYDAIMVGVGTVLIDDPSLTCRLPGNGGRDPVRVVLDSTCRTPVFAKILNQDSSAPTIIACTRFAPREKIKALRAAGAEIVQVASREGMVDPKALLIELARREITSVILEGGAQVGGTFLNHGLVDKVIWFLAPKIIGGKTAPSPVGDPGIKKLADARTVDIDRIYRCGDDVCIEGYLNNT